MPSTPHWTEWNVNSTSKAASRTDSDWKSIDDSTTAYSAAPVTAGNYSFTKYQALSFDTGAWNNLSAFGYKIDSNNPNDNIGNANLSVYGNTVSGFTAPISSTTLDSSLMSTVGITCDFATTSPWVAGSSTTAGASTSSLYANALRTQLRTASTSAPGDAQSARTITASWTES